MKDDKDIETFMFKTMNITKVQQFLESHPSLDPREYKDHRGNSIIHHLCYQSFADLLKIYVNHTARLLDERIRSSRVLYPKSVKQEIGVWLNEKNPEGWTPILYASYLGNIQIIQYLEAHGANIHSVNKTKLNVMMMAAQGNKVPSMIYFKDKIDVNLCDERGSTALHWASYNGGEDTVTFLLTLKNININIRDEKGQTPLMLATMYGNTRIVRKLLVQGANRYIKDIDGKKPIQMSIENEFHNITRMLNEEYTCFDFFKFYYNVKLQYRPKSRAKAVPIVFILTSLCSIFILHSLIFAKQPWMYVIQGFIFLFMYALYFSLIRQVKPQEKDDIMNYIQETKKICLVCVRKKPIRSYHCDICNRCIEQYDHHCTWINNCVGKYNIARFIFFLIFLVLCFAVVGMVSGCGLIKVIFKSDGDLAFFDDNFQLIHLLGRSEVRAAYIGLLLINFCLSLFFFPVLLLLIFQVKNLLINKTTYERMRQPSSLTSSTISAKQKLRKKRTEEASLRNCKTMCQASPQNTLTGSTATELEEQLLSI